MHTKMELTRITKEILWHFTCDSCRNWWSVSAIDSNWKPRKQYCSHCGHKHEYSHESVETKLIDSGDYT
jgi:transcription elongation factor Elf1